jgi:hypothetical protein
MDGHVTPWSSQNSPKTSRRNPLPAPLPKVSLPSHSLPATLHWIRIGFSRGDHCAFPIDRWIVGRRHIRPRSSSIACVSRRLSSELILDLEQTPPIPGRRVAGAAVAGAPGCGMCQGTDPVCRGCRECRIPARRPIQSPHLPFLSLCRWAAPSPAATLTPVA